MQGNQKIAKRIVDIFLKDVPQSYQELEKHLADCNEKNIEITAHTIKGATASISGEELRAIAEEMEKAAKSKDLASITKHMDDLRNAIDEIKIEIEKWYKK